MSPMLAPLAIMPNKLESDLIRYLTSLRVKEFKAESKAVAIAIREQFPELGNGEPHTLEHLGIPFVFQVSKLGKTSVITCSVTQSEIEAQNQFVRFSNQQYQALRSTLNIDSHWVFLVTNDDINLNAREEFIDCFANYEDDGAPTCWITDNY